MTLSIAETYLLFFAGGWLLCGAMFLFIPKWRIPHDVRDMSSDEIADLAHDIKAECTRRLALSESEAVQKLYDDARRCRDDDKR